MKRSISFPIIQVDSFITQLVEGTTSCIYHVYVNDQFYRACGSKDEVKQIIASVIENELGGI
jgi:hypothetical protein